MSNHFINPLYFISFILLLVCTGMGNVISTNNCVHKPSPFTLQNSFQQFQQHKNIFTSQLQDKQAKYEDWTKLLLSIEQLRKMIKADDVVIEPFSKISSAYANALKQVSIVRYVSRDISDTQQLYEEPQWLIVNLDNLEEKINDYLNISKENRP